MNHHCHHLSSTQILADFLEKEEGRELRMQEREKHRKNQNEQRKAVKSTKSTNQGMS
jgi:hypothetical protein